MAYGGVKTCEKSRLAKWSSGELSIPGSLWSAIAGKHSNFQKGSLFFFLFLFLFISSSQEHCSFLNAFLTSNFHLGEEITLRVGQII